jgi:DNA-binding CsgD family transcriptional regulator
VERERELSVLSEGVRGLGASLGTVVVVEAVAGQGKTALLEFARDLASADGIQLLGARARHLEATTPYELLRRLLGPWVYRHGGPAGLRDAAAFAAPLFTPGAEAAAGVDYGCQWLLAALADDGPLVVVVDDAHWADADSLRVLADLAEDLRHEPILLVVAARPAENPAVQPILARLATCPAAVLVRPAPLTATGVRAVLRDAFGTELPGPFAEGCLRASGGNVFYLRELIRPWLAAGAVPDAAAVRELDATGPSALARTVHARLGQLGEASTLLVRAAAVLGDGTPLAHAAALAGLDDRHAVVEAARLTAAAILARGDPIHFPHPLVLAAVEHLAPPGLLASMHARAVTMLRAAGAPDRQIAQHVLASPPAASADVSRLLLAEARRNLDSGSASVAHQLLLRALAEPPPTDARPAVLLALAKAERAVGELPQARVRLTEIIDRAPRRLRIEAISDLLEVLDDLDDRAAVGDLHRRAFATRPYGNSPEEIRLRAILLVHVAIGLAPAAPRRLTNIDPWTLPTRSGEERHLVVCSAIYRRAAEAGAEDEFLAHLKRAVRDLPADRPLTYWEVYAALEAAAFLASVEAMSEADEVLGRLRPDVARLQGAAPDLRAEHSHRVILNLLRRGQFEDALAQVTGAEAFAHRHGLVSYAGFANYARGCIRLEHGDYPEAGRLLLRAPTGEGAITALGLLLADRPAEALALLAQFRYELDPAAPVHETEIQFEPHLIASHAHTLLGNRDAAVAEADRELAVRRRHGPQFRLGLALRRRATFAPTRDAVTLLEEAVRVCAATPRLPVLARVSAGYGAALRRHGHLVEARLRLTEALDLADRLGMTRLRGRITADLRAAGGRPRRSRVTGVEALTQSQRAVAELAARGHTNRQIAERLYVTIKTVETHLAAVYRKLGVTGRDRLARLLPDDRPPEGLAG